jgi:hypothetical protein
MTYYLTICPLELIIQQGLQSPACLQQLGGDVYDWTPLLEGCWNRNFSKKKRVLTSIGNIQNDRGPGEVLLPPGPRPGILLLEGSSFENLICKYAHLQTTEPRRHFDRWKAPQSTSVTQANFANLDRGFYTGCVNSNDGSDITLSQFCRWGDLASFYRTAGNESPGRAQPCTNSVRPGRKLRVLFNASVVDIRTGLRCLSPKSPWGPRSRLIELPGLPVRLGWDAADGQPSRPPAARPIKAEDKRIGNGAGNLPRPHNCLVLEPYFLLGTPHWDHFESLITSSKDLLKTNFENVNLLDQCKRAYQDEELSRLTFCNANICAVCCLSFVYVSII